MSFQEDNESLASTMDFEFLVSEHSSRDDKAYEELLEVVTHVVARLQIDWPRKQETSKCFKLEDRFLSGGHTMAVCLVGIPWRCCWRTRMAC